jgi:hypothetical protein
MLAGFFIAKPGGHNGTPCDDDGRTSRRVANHQEENTASLEGAGGGPKFVKLGRCVRYLESDLEDFVAQRTLNHTSSMAPQRVGAQEG